MGMNIYTYVGCYVELPVVEQTINTNHYGCSNNQCKNHEFMNQSNKFCPICGSPGQFNNIEKKVTTTLDWYSFTEINQLSPDNLICANDTNFLISNLSLMYADTLSNESMHLEMTGDFIKNAMEEFQFKFGKELEKFKEIHGFELKVKFGLISYYA